MLSRKTISIFLTASLLLVSSPFAYASDPWPGGTSTLIASEGSELSSGYEPSGAVIHQGKLLIVNDQGELTRMDLDGSNAETWSIGGDLEAVTVIDDDSDLVYIGREHPDAVLEFDLSTEALTGETWDLTGTMTGYSNYGLEALTYIDGNFYAGHQGYGLIYVFELTAGGGVAHIDTITPTTWNIGLSGLHYDPDEDIIRAIYALGSLLVEMDPDGNVTAEYDLEGSNQEGIAFSSCDDETIYIAQDDGEVWTYEDYPRSCPSTPLADLIIQNAWVDTNKYLLHYGAGNNGDLDANVSDGGQNYIYLDSALTRIRRWVWESRSAEQFLTAGTTIHRIWYLYRESELANFSVGSEYEVEICIDATEVVTESDESNNCDSATFTFDGDLPDLYTSETAWDQDTLTLDYEIGNSGQISVLAFWDGANEITLNSESLGITKWSADSSNTYMNSGSSEARSYSLDASLLTEGESYNLEICTDSKNAIASEISESNNCVEVSFTY
jgi:uncharacterized protein YjiK